MCLNLFKCLPEQQNYRILHTCAGHLHDLDCFYRCMEKGCMKVFITRYQFKRHQELHKNVSCELCNKLFTAARSLKRHKNKQHLLIAESQDDTDNPLVAAHDIAFIIA